MSVKDYFLPETREDAVALLAQHGPSLLVIAGGTVAMPLINEGISLPDRVMGLRRAGLDRVDRTGDGVRIGAAATLSTILEHSGVPLLAEAARRTATWAVRNMATIGGNLFVPPPGGDVAVALLALDATVTLAGPRGERTLPLTDFYTGFMTSVLAPDELLVEIGVPAAGGPSVFVKHGRRQANTPSVVTVAIRVVLDGDAVTDARIALGGAGPHPLRATEAEAVVIGSALDPATIERAAATAAEHADPPTDAVATAWYRRRIVEVVVGRALGQLHRDRPGEGR